MENKKLGGKITLSNFDLNNQEMIIAKKIIGNYARKISNIKDYQELKLEMKSHEKGKNRIFEINGLVIFDNGNASSKAEGFNPFVLMNDVLGKITKEIESKTKNER